jgi:hypothetical protein
VTLSRGAACRDDSSTPCRSADGYSASYDCTWDSCARVGIAISGFVSDFSCEMRLRADTTVSWDGSAGAQSARDGYYYRGSGFATKIRITCSSAHQQASHELDWPAPSSP